MEHREFPSSYIVEGMDHLSWISCAYFNYLLLLQRKEVGSDVLFFFFVLARVLSIDIIILEKIKCSCWYSLFCSGNRYKGMPMKSTLFARISCVYTKSCYFSYTDKAMLAKLYCRSGCSLIFT